MIDPLGSFDWSTLHALYDQKCQWFNKGAKYLDFLSYRPESDRELYYLLIDCFARKRLKPYNIDLRIYEALLYWKLCSQPAAVKNVLELARSRRNSTYWQNQLTGLCSSLPANIERNSKGITSLVKEFGRFHLFGMRSPDSLPVRTTFLHFVYPHTVPIFDKMVLKAVGIEDKNANKNFGYLERYILHVWVLVDKYSSCFPKSARESPIRMIEMALWSLRGNATRCCH